MAGCGKELPMTVIASHPEPPAESSSVASVEGLLVGRAAWAGRDGEITLTLDRSLLPRVIRRRMSVSTAQSIESCPARWAMGSVLPRLEDPFGAAELGIATHQVFEDLFRLPAVERTIDTARDILAGLADAHPDLQVPPAGDVEARKRWRDEIDLRMVGLWRIEDPTEVDVVATEQRIKVAVAGIPVVAVIDRVDRNWDQVKVTLNDYKGLALDTPIPTPTGWTTMGELAVGDSVLGGNGKPANVVDTSAIHHRPCYRITFSDGESIVCDNVHQWVVSHKVPRVHNETVSAPELLLLRERLDQHRGQRVSIAVQNSASLELPEADLLVDPWILGAWLGDGRSRDGSLTIGTGDLVDMKTLIKERWGDGVRLDEQRTKRLGRHQVTVGPPQPDLCLRAHNNWVQRSHGRTCRSCVYERVKSWRHGCVPPGEHPTCGKRQTLCPEKFSVGRSAATNLPLQVLLGELGVLNKKHVPGVYLRASRQQRLDLLRGLMDTDGSWNPQRRRAVFVNTNERLADAVVELALSLGVTPYKLRVEKTKTHHHSAAFQVSFRPVGFNPFLLPRKAVAVDASISEGETSCGVGYQTSRATRRTIKSIEQVKSVPTRCITVDTDDALFLCGRTFIPTHNCGLAKPPKLFFGDHHGEQLRMYALAWAAHTGGPLPAAAQVYYVAYGKSRKVGLARPKLVEASDGLVRAWERMQAFSETAAFPTKASALCGWCPMAQVCPAAAAAGRAEPRSPEALIGPVLGVAGLPQTGIAAGGAPAAESSRAEPNRRPLDAQDYTTGPGSGRPIERGSSMRHEDKPWVEEIEGRLNFSSYAAGAAFGLAELAVETLHQAGVALTGQSVYALADTFATVIANVQRVMDAKVNMAEGLHTRLRGALRTSLVTLPAPFGADQEAWAAWVAATERRLRAIVTVAERLWQAERDKSGQPWTALAGATAEPIESAA